MTGILRNVLSASDGLLIGAEEGLLVFEAENYNVKNYSGETYWEEVSKEFHNASDHSYRLGSSGEAYLISRPLDTDILRTNYAILSYEIEIKKPGRYHVWARGLADSESKDSIFVWKGKGKPKNNRILLWESSSQWAWSNFSHKKSEVVYTFEAPGTYTINFSLREGGFCFDRWMLVPEHINKYSELWTGALE